MRTKYFVFYPDRVEVAEAQAVPDNSLVDLYDMALYDGIGLVAGDDDWKALGNGFDLGLKDVETGTYTIPEAEKLGLPVSRAK